MPEHSPQITLVERSYQDPDDYLMWETVGLFMEFHQAFEWCQTNRDSFVILLEEPQVIDRSSDGPVNFVDRGGVRHLVDWDAVTLDISSVKIMRPNMPNEYCSKAFRIRQCDFGPMAEAKSSYRTIAQ